jgi:hypothetical protein
MFCLLRRRIETGHEEALILDRAGRDDGRTRSRMLESMSMRNEQTVVHRLYPPVRMHVALADDRFRDLRGKYNILKVAYRALGVWYSIVPE